ncbi:MAG: UDP-N-acetylmuramoyl-L-alanine--D-glutamate ligase [Desulfobacca sp.]|uniref:UDP-N-acetylmuramoyl-L-alanine--D-glutamate ligase n=1 Tax=Desulfobacca sp. TaxID=2067990 RepID=UPI00404ADA09
MDYAGKKALVVGLGKTGLALCRFLAARGAVVTATDSSPATALTTALEALHDLPITLEVGVAVPAAWPEQDLIVLSPGVPPELPWLMAAAARGIPILGDLEVASHFFRLPVVAISGTNGKTTTTTLVGELLRASGRRPLVGGNIGTPLVEMVAAQGQADTLVLEISSFQLDTAPSFHAQAAALLNISADHLDRYPDLQAYSHSKAGLFRHQGPADVAVLNADDPLVAGLAANLSSRVYWFSRHRPQHLGAWLTDSRLQVQLADGRRAAVPLHHIKLQGGHNLENIMAALLLALEMGADPEACVAVLRCFNGLPHRLQWVANVGGVDFYDDSKGTNVGAVVRALQHFDRPIVLIAGGRDKGGDYAPLAPLVRQKVRQLILLGEAKEVMAAALAGQVPIRLAVDMTAAVQLALAAAQPGDVVLLSPACSSFDMFRDYAERGRVFQNAVKELRNGRADCQGRPA